MIDFVGYSPTCFGSPNGKRLIFSTGEILCWYGSLPGSVGHNYIALTVPIAVFRHASKSAPWERLGVPSPPNGLATIADYQITFTYTHTF